MGSTQADRLSPVPRLRRDDVRRRVLDGAMDAFAERGFSGTSIDTICSRVGLSRGAFYSNFSDKEALFLELLERRMQQLTERIEPALERVRGGAEPMGVLVDMLSDRGPDELRWDLLNKEFIIYALRNDGARARLLRHHTQLRGLIAEALRQLFALTKHQAAVDLEEIARLLLALHEGDVTQRALEPSRRAAPSLDAIFMPRILAVLASSD